MTNYTIEIGGEESSLCKCCNENSITAHGFVYRNKDAYAVYYASWSTAHDDKKVSFALAIGEWGDDSTSEDRVCFGVEAKDGSNQILFRVLDPEESPWPDTSLLGKMLNREIAISHSNLNEIYIILEKILREHRIIGEYLGVSVD